MFRFSRQLLACARGKAGLPHRVRRGADQGRSSRVTDSRGIRRAGHAPGCRRGDAGGNPCVRLQRGRLPCADVHHGDRAASRQPGAEAEVSAGYRRRPAPAAGLRRDRAHQWLRYHEAPDAGRAEERSLPCHRPKGLDVARAAIRSHAAAGAHDAIGRGEEEKRGALGVPGRRQGIARPRTGHQAAASDGQSQHDGSLLRVPASADGEL